MTPARRLPQRTCVACRQTRPKEGLLRVVRTPTGDVRVDRTGKAAGRGAYVCRSGRCARETATPRKLSRALGVAVGPEVLADFGAVIPADEVEADDESAND
jgi:predicted RNA-binding protein YlxR (DUF448 family)